MYHSNSMIQFNETVEQVRSAYEIYKKIGAVEPELWEGMNNMEDIILDPESTPDEVEMALATIAEAITPYEKS